MESTCGFRPCSPGRPASTRADPPEWETREHACRGTPLRWRGDRSAGDSSPAAAQGAVGSGDAWNRPYPVETVAPGRRIPHDAKGDRKSAPIRLRPTAIGSTIRFKPLVQDPVRISGSDIRFSHPHKPAALPPAPLHGTDPALTSVPAVKGPVAARTPPRWRPGALRRVPCAQCVRNPGVRNPAAPSAPAAAAGAAPRRRPWARPGARARRRPCARTPALARVGGRSPPCSARRTSRARPAP